MKKKREEKRKLEHQIVKSPEILNLCDRRRERNDLNRKGLRNTGKYNIKRCMKKANENWIGEQCSKIEENLRKNSSKKAYQLVKDLTTETRKSYYCPRLFREVPHRRTRDTEPMDRILL